VHIVRVRHLFYPDMPRDYVFELSERQVKAGHKVDVLTWNRNGHRFEERVAEDFTIYRLPGFNFSIDNAVKDYPYLPSLPSKIAKLKPEIIHAESHLFLITVQAVRKAKKLGIPSVVTVRGVMAKRSFIINLAQYCYLCTLGLWLFNNVDRIICLTKSDAQEIIRFGCPSDKVRVIPNAVDANCFRPRKERQENLVAWVGRFVPEKGVKYLIRAAKLVAKEFRDVKFMLIGYGQLRARAIKLAYDYDLLNDVVHFAGPFNRSQVANVLGKASIFVFPSLKEGLPLALLEAMACGTPVVASNIPGIDEVIENNVNGILVPPKSSRALAEAVLTLLRDEQLRKRLGKSARETVVEKFTWGRVLKELECVYGEALQRFGD